MFSVLLTGSQLSLPYKTRHEINEELMGKSISMKNLQESVVEDFVLKDVLDFIEKYFVSLTLWKLDSVTKYCYQECASLVKLCITYIKQHCLLTEGRPPQWHTYLMYADGYFRH